MVSTSFFRTGIAAAALTTLGALAPIDAVKASGPVERLLQVMTVPKDPNRLIARYGAASEGLLFSKDGRSFQAMCTGAIEKSLDRIAPGGSIYLSPITIDGSGALLINTFDALWSGTGDGCTWTKQTDPALNGKWLTSLKLDPTTGTDIFALANVSSGENEAIEAYPELLRRTADNKWTVVGQVRRKAAMLRAYGGELLAAKTATGTRLYASLTASVGSLSEPQTTSVAASDDGGKTWRESPPVPASQEYLTLLGVDPTQPDRVLAVVASDGADTLLVSEDQAKTFKTYGSVQEVSGVSFGADGRVFIGDTGGNGLEGGVLTAARLGQPLTKVPSPAVMDTPNVDCVDFDPRTSKLRVCKLNRLGELDYQTGVFTELVQFETVQGLIDCPDRDIKAVCEQQMNAGASWCCSGHYPFTDFCGGYDVTESSGRRVSCGLTGRAAEIEAGRGPTARPDAGAKPAAQADAGATRALPNLYSQDSESSEQASADTSSADVSGGCSLSDGRSGTSLLSTALLALLALGVGRVVRRRAFASSRRS